MGYNTEFEGELKFTHDLSAKELKVLEKMLGEDCRNHPEWADSGANGLYYVDLVVTDDAEGLRWDDSTEKTYDLDRIVNMLIREMRKTYPTFGLVGELQAQGEEAKDRWVLFIGDDGFAHRRTIPVADDEIECPECGHSFKIK